MAETLRELLLRIQADTASALALVPGTAEPASVTVRAGEDLQAALDKGGVINIEDDAVFEGIYVIRVSGTRVVGPNASIHSKLGDAALTIAAGVQNVDVTLKEATTVGGSAVIQIGPYITNEADLPRNIVFRGLQVPTHRGKRAFEINAANVALLDCGCRDVYDPGGRDSQGVLIYNTPGDIVIRGGTYEAGSENILVGGAATGIPDIQPTNILVEDVVLSRPLSWKTDGIKRKVKCLFELKAGTNVTLRRAVLDGCWVDGQVGWALMFTPRDGKRVANVLVEDVTILNSGGALCVQGFDDVQIGPQVDGVTLRRVNASVSNVHGTGRFAQWSHCPKNITIEDSVYDGQAQIIYAFNGEKWENGVYVSNTDGTRGVKLVNNRFACRSYGISVNGYTSGMNWQQGFPDGIIENNTLTGPTALNHQGRIPVSNVLQP